MIPHTPLDHLPHHLLKLIAYYSDELSVWRLAATSVVLREAAHIPLQQHLASKSITSKPPYVLDIFEPMNVAAETDAARHASLENTIRLFKSHLAIFPPSRTRLRNFTVEVRLDDYDTGWQQIKRFGGVLESLNLHFIDPLGLVPDAGVDEYDPYDDEGTMGELWPELVDKPLSKLHSLTIATNVRILHHLGGLAPFIPRLRHLTLSCFGPDEFEYTVFDAPDLTIRFDTLVSLTLAGYPTMVIFSLDRILPLARNLTTLTIRFPTDSNMPISINNELVRVIKAISRRKALTSLGLHGGAGDTFLNCMASLQSMDPGRFEYAHITAMAMERQGGKRGKGVYPLMDTEAYAHFPSLCFITYFDRQTDKKGASTLGSYDRAGFHDFFRSKPLYKLFANQPRLRQVLWTAGYPSSPFDTSTSVVDWEEQNIRCRVQRKDGEKGGHLGAPHPGDTADIKLRAQRAVWKGKAK